MAKYSLTRLSRMIWPSAREGVRWRCWQSWSVIAVVGEDKTGLVKYIRVTDVMKVFIYHCFLFFIFCCSLFYFWVCMPLSGFTMLLLPSVPRHMIQCLTEMLLYRRYMAEILPIRRKTLSNQSINHVFCNFETFATMDNNFSRYWKIKIFFTLCSGNKPRWLRSCSLHTWFLVMPDT